MCKVIINGKTEYIPEDTLLSEVIKKSGQKLDHPCGGKGICKKCRVFVNGKEELSCKYAVKSDITVSFSESGSIQSETGIEQSGKRTEKLCFVLDIGTTTLALALVSLDEKETIKVLTDTNPQTSFGADVISRIAYCQKNGADTLQRVLISKINSMIAQFGVESVPTLLVSGNTTMLHLFFGKDCSSMGTAPYTPIFLKEKSESALKLGIKGIGSVKALPSVAAFVGADIVAGLSLIGKPQAGRFNLLVDLGTNAEIVLMGHDSALCTAAAAGPCFEGAAISCGMSATNGAIYSYKNGRIKTVGNAPAKGICGTGLIDAVAYLLENGLIDKSGYMPEEEFMLTQSVSISQEDIRQYQLAKSAVYSAIMTLMKLKGITFDSIDKMYISGGFSAQIDTDSAVNTGLLPRELRSVCIAINNSSLHGAIKYAFEESDLSGITDSTSYVDLSLNPDFSALFIENMLF